MADYGIMHKSEFVRRLIDQNPFNRITFQLELWKLETNDYILEGMMDNSRYYQVDCIQRELYAIVSLHALGLISRAVLNYCRYMML